jgi:NTE family protein
LRGISGRNRDDNPLLSFLLFEQSYTEELIALGYSDAMSERDQLLDFVTGKEVPRLFAPDWVTQDLSGFD